MKKPGCNNFSIFLNILLILFLALYFLVPFVDSGFLSKIYSPLCGIIDRFQGELYLPAWCDDVLNPQIPIKNENVNQNNNVNSNTNGSVGIANPASTKCLADKGILENYKDANGDFGICVFADKSICDEWAYFRSECQKGQCFKECQQAGTKTEGWYDSCTKKLLKYDNCAPDNNSPVAESANIVVKNPLADAQLTSPFKVEGQARVFENQVNIRLKSRDGRTLIAETAMVKSPDVGQWGDFSLEISYDFSLTKEGFVEVYSTSAKDGSEENLVSIPVKF